MQNFVENQQIELQNNFFYFETHPFFKKFLFAQEGRKATVYKLHDKFGDKKALKIFKPAFRNSVTEFNATLLKPLALLPGLRAADCTVITYSNSPKALSKFEELEYAILMPWVEGEPWLTSILARKQLPVKAAIRLAAQLAQILYNLEKQELAHCDLSGSNLLLDMKTLDFNLIGLDSIYGSNFLQPNYRIFGSPGYSHSKSPKENQWCLFGDRFAGAILIGEILGWSDLEVINNPFGETYFAESEMGQICRRYLTLRSKLKCISSEIENLFTQAWFSKQLHKCPAFETWYNILSKIT